MTTSTKQFAWKDRDTAAHDLLQLVYHAPPYISLLAVHLLEAIRSPNIIPELLEIIEDEKREMWQRIYALRAIVKTPGDWYFPQFANHMKSILRNHERILENHPHPDRAYFGNDMLDDIRGLAAYHPSNRDWFFAILDATSNPIVVQRFLINAIYYGQPVEFRSLLFDFLLKLLEKHPYQLTTSVIRTLSYRVDATVQTWLNQHLASIVKTVSADLTDPDTFAAAEQWVELRERLIQVDASFKLAFDAYMAKLKIRREETRTQRKENLPDYRLSSAYLHLQSLYQQAANGDKKAYHKLVKTAKSWQGNIPMRAVATHFIGKLRDTYSVAGILCYLLKYAQDDWDNDIAPLSPIRAEAGEVLKDTASPEVWALMVDAFFIDHRNVLSDFMLNWIAHMTDMLDGIHTSYGGARWGNENNRRWFRALAEISEGQLQQEIAR